MSLCHHTLTHTYTHTHHTYLHTLTHTHTTHTLSTHTLSPHTYTHLHTHTHTPHLLTHTYTHTHCGTASRYYFDFGRKSGPKSRRRLLAIIFLYTAIMNNGYCLKESDRGEGCTPSMGSAEASWNPFLPPTFDAKPHGTQPTMRDCAQMSLKPKTHPKIVKRSLLRAHRRAAQTGMTWYRGKCMTPQDFAHMGLPPVAQDDRQPRSNDVAQCHQHNAPKRRLLCAAWNGGGLSNHRLDDLKCWLTMQRIQVAVISETRWTFQSTWSDAEWHHIHSTDPTNRGAGVLILVAKRLCNAANLRWNELVPGRLVHVRLLMSTRNIDIVGCYQHVFSTASSCLSTREQYWKALDNLLEMLPARNTLALLGDMNCSLPFTAGTCGCTTFRWRDRLVPGTAHPDANRFLHILVRHGLVALNTWSSRDGPSFVSCNGVSRIDYFCTRKQFADGKAKNTQYVWDTPFQPLTQNGHALLVGHIAMHWIPTTSQQIGLTPHQKLQGRFAKMTNSHAWQQYVAASSNMLHQQLLQVQTSDALDLTTVHEHAITQFAHHFPAASRTPKPSPWQLNPITFTKWDHRKTLSQIQGHSKKAVFQAWFHVCKFTALDRQHRRFAQQLRRMKFDELLHEATRAAQTHDTHRLFQLINRNSPKTPNRRLQLRSPHGHLMTPSEERGMLACCICT